MPTLVLLRHGQSQWNLENRFTGWWDVDLTEQGEAEATAGGVAMLEAGVLPDVVHTSLQKRAIRTANLALDAMDRSWLRVVRNWRLNERHYGALTGLDKKETAERHGAEQLHAWRRGYNTPPPVMEVGHEFDPAAVDGRYNSIAPEVLPRTECLADVVDRLVPYWQDTIATDLMAGRIALVAAHGNSLRALVKHLDDISDGDIAELNIPTGVPVLYELGDDLRPIEDKDIADRFLGDAEAARAAAEAVARQAG
jgi:2,3-bisphosphoglycerate-dependent phosphoglycerate mutase